MTHVQDDPAAAARASQADATLAGTAEAQMHAGARVAASSRTPRPLPELRERIAVMAIVNRTADSFFDQGRTFALDAAIAAGLQAAADGADIIDVGGVKFAPGEPLPVAEEIDRVVPVIAALRAELPGTLLSVDTFHAAVAEAAISAGADLINDTTGLSDPAMAPVVAATGASIVLTHSLAQPRRELPSPRYADVAREVQDFLETRLEQALAAGVGRDRIILDPGPDLNKSTLHTLELLREWPRFAELGMPVLAAFSRKDVIGEALGLAKEDRLAGSLAAAAWGIRHGARVVRAHDVPETVQLARMLEVIAGWREPAGPLVHNA